MSEDDHLDAHNEKQMSLMDKGLKRVVVCTESDIEQIAKQVNQDLKAENERLVGLIKTINSDTHRRYREGEYEWQYYLMTQAALDGWL